MPAASIAIDLGRIADFCRRHHIARLSLFGSAIRDDFTAESDVDVLAEFEPGRKPGLEFFAMGDELSQILGRRVDLNTPEFLSRYFRGEVLAGARPIYESARER
jgi:predicted nucleotidyltransferase